MTTSRRKSKRASPSSRKTRPSKQIRVSIIGAGRLGTALGRALDRAGHPIDLVVAKHAAKARRSVSLINSSAVALGASQLDQLRRSDHERLQNTNLLLISTPDDALGTVAGQLSQVFRTKRPGRPGPGKQPRIALHTSGAISSNVLKPLRAAGFAIGSMHPLISVAYPETNGDIFGQAFFCLEGDSAAVKAARSIVGELNGRSFTIDAASKALYHAAAVMSSGHVVALFDLAIEMLTVCGLSPRRAQQVLLPLLESTSANLLGKSPARSLTGTFSRRDLATVEKHLSAMKSAKLSEAIAAYVMLGRRSLHLSRAAGNSDRSEQIDQLLSRFRVT